MCGICGMIGQNDTEGINAMVSAMRHRGPDDSGVFQEEGIALGMTRLAIIDTTKAGHQPMRNADGTVWIVYNGETYNFKTERETLRQKGHSFQSSTDTEVVLKMYEEYGDDFLRRLRGMFALGIYDKRKGRGKEKILLARDHFGIKPLLYWRTGSRLIFSSELKAMLACGLINKTFDPEALRLLLSNGSIPQPKTAITGVKMLLPGHRLILESGEERIERFWQLDAARCSELNQKSYEDQLDFVKSALEESVRLQMVSDVPIGAFLSGGVDSSLLVALMSQIVGSKVKTFSVGFETEGQHIDETDQAQRLAKFIGTDHSRVVVNGQTVREKMSHIVTALDQPTVDGVNAYFVSQAARQSVTVAISGTGGDELFAGYPWFMAMVSLHQQNKKSPLTASLKKLVGILAQLNIFDPLSKTGLGELLDRSRAGTGFLSQYSRQYQIYGMVGAAKLLNSELAHHASIGREPAKDVIFSENSENHSIINKVSAVCLRTYTQNQLLRDIDSVSMSHSLEVRVPFLDPKIADAAFSLPDSTKLGDLSKVRDFHKVTYRDSGAKKILIDIGKEFLPDDIDNQQKSGFGMPFGHWLKGPLRDILEEALDETTVRKRGFFDVTEATRIKNDFLKDKSSWYYPWLLIVTELWCKEILD